MDGGGGGAGQLIFFMHLSGPNRVTKFLYAPAPLPPTVWALKPRGLFTSLFYLWLTYVYAHLGMLVCTRIMHMDYAGMHT
jgi:hypothetical protein